MKTWQIRQETFQKTDLYVSWRKTVWRTRGSRMAAMMLQRILKNEEQFRQFFLKYDLYLR